MVDDVRELAAIFRRAGLDDKRLKLVIDDGATHHESAWARRFPEALAFLFGQAGSVRQDEDSVARHQDIFYDPAPSEAEAGALAPREMLQIRYTVIAIAITESWTCVHRVKGPSSGNM